MKTRLLGFSVGFLSFLKKHYGTRIEDAANESITTMRLARASPRAAEVAIRAGTAKNDLQLLLDDLTATHEAALTFTRNLSAALAATGLESINRRMSSAEQSVRDAKIQADRLSSEPTRPQARKTRDADYKAITQLADLTAAFQDNPERKRKK